MLKTSRCSAGWPIRRWALALIFLLVALPELCFTAPPNIMRGFSSRDFDNLYYWDTGSNPIQKAKRAIDDVKRAGGRWWRPHIVWGKVEPSLLYPRLTRSQVTSSLVNTYISRTDWTFYDQLVSYANSQGVGLIFVLCPGYIAPFNQMPMYGGRPVTPRSDVSIGPDAYTANCYLHARACVRRYKSSVHWWQCENEINMAGWQTQYPIGAGYTWRDGAEWWSGSFCEGVLRAIKDAVKIEDGTATTTLNFHQLNKDAINAWAPLLDVVGYDYYPSNISTDDLYEELVDVQARAGAGKPVLLCETGYDPGAGSITADKQRDFEDWIVRSYDSTVRTKVKGVVNLKGYLFFTLCTAEIDQDGEHMGLIQKPNVYKWGYDVIQDLFGSPYTHETQKFNDFEAQTGFSAGSSATAQIEGSATAYDGYYCVKLVTNWAGSPGTNSRCVIVRRPDGSSTDIRRSDRIGFTVYDVGGSNTVRITLVDQNNAVFSTWSDSANSRNTRTVQGRWTLVTYPVSAVTGIDKTRVKEIRIGFYWAGTYYIDHVTRIK
ncbi:MAG: hypothetical protein HYX75_07995 [Acidobacteria bacterium]|nr:hypothetical protein [Acidobacteriota bacterium]